MIILDIFCGAGGFSLGFKQVYPHATFIGVDSNMIACLTYAKNISKNVYCININENSVFWLINFIMDEYGKIDVLIGSPPCQQFSTANKTRTFDTTLIELFLLIKFIIKPKIWIMEEVPSVGKIGEKEKWFIPRYLKACEFGLLHIRKRLFAGNYPEPKKKENSKNIIPTPNAAIRGYGHGKKQRERIMYDFYRLQKTLTKKQYISTPLAKEWKGHTKRKSCGLTNDIINAIGLPEIGFTKIVTTELCAFVMGFPSDFVFLGNKKQQYRQIGNAVCPPISKAIAKAMTQQKTLEDYE